MTKRRLLSLALLFVLAACGDDGSGAAATTTTVAAETTTTTTAGPTPFPPERQDLEHGGDAWAFVLAGAAASEAPELEEATRVATEAGYTAGPTTCDQGAALLLGLPENSYTVSVFLEDEAGAHQAAQAFQDRGWEGGAVGVVQTYCLD